MSLLSCAMAAVVLLGMTAQPPAIEYLADRPYLIAYTQQGWGELGLNTCAHAPGVEPLPLQIGDCVYARGLGHHAPGEIDINLAGRYAAFDADVGVQRQPSGAGSVVFRVVVDGRKRFDSGVMRETDAPKSVRVELRGAESLRLVTTDAGDGILCDCADWADARLTTDPAARLRPVPPAFDVAPFARVVTWDPARMDGARSSRVQEFRAADLFLETDVVPRRDGSRVVPVRHGAGCIGLQWLERRKLKRIGIVFLGAAPVVAPGAQAQVWVGESPSQGRWVPLAGEIRREGAQWLLDIDPARNPDAWKGTSKLRWVLPGSGKRILVRRLVALTVTPTATARLWLRASGRLVGRSVRLVAYNGAIEPLWHPRRPPAPNYGGGGSARLEGSPITARGAKHSQEGLRHHELFPANALPLQARPAVLPRYRWSGGAVTRRLSQAPVAITVRYTRPRPWKCDRTVLRFALPTGIISVAADDVLSHGVVWVPSAGLTVSLPGRSAPVHRGLTVLERVRRMPDQTLARAMKRTRNPIQDLGPMMLSLACDNRKFIAEREGIVRGDAAVVTPRFGSEPERETRLYTRRLEGGWLPAPVTTTVVGGVTYTQRSYVAPTTGARLTDCNWHEEHPVCVVEYTLANRGTAPASASLTLTLAPGEHGVGPLAWRLRGGGADAVAAAGVLVAADTRQAGALCLAADGAALTVRGTLPAGQSSLLRVLLPASPLAEAASDALLARGDLFAAMRAHWNRVLAPAARIEVPDRFITNLIRASQVHCMIATRNEADGARYAPWAAAAVYGALESESNSPIRGLDLMGNHEYARRCLDYFIQRYSPAGYLTTGYTLMGTGWHLQTLGEHYMLAHDTAWMRRVAPAVARVCGWVVRQRHKTTRRDAFGRRVPVYGLMPPGVMADWNAFAYYFCLNGYYCAGLREAGRALADVGRSDGCRYTAESAAMARDILRAYRWTQARTPVVPLRDGTWVTAAPSQVYVTGPTNDFFPGEDGNRSWCYDVELGAHQLVPQGVIAANSAECTRIMNRMEDADFLSDGWFDYPGELSRRDWFDRGGFSKVQPYYCRNAEIYAMRDDVKPFLRSFFNTVAAMVSTENLSFWEHFHNGGAWNKTHETGYFLQQSRSMLVMERGRSLWLASLVPSAWLRPGAEIAVHNAPTAFGPVSYRIRCASSSRGILVTIAAPRRTTPERVVVRLRLADGRRPRAIDVIGAPRSAVVRHRSDISVARPAGLIRLHVRY